MIIKCPECGHEVSDRAPVCPHCGVEIARYRNTFTSNTNSQTTQQQSAPAKATPNGNGPKKNNTGLFLLIAFIIIIIVAVGGIYFYRSNMSDNREESAYEEAMESDDTSVLESYLNEFKDAPLEHRDSIQAHLTRLNQAEREWNDAEIANTRSGWQQYIDSHSPDSPYVRIAKHKVDSLDWASALSAATPEAIKSYIDRHPDGEHIDEANDKIHTINSTTIQPEEKQMIADLFRHFFQSVNKRSEDGLTETVSDLMSTFLGKPDATKSDVTTFLQKLWKDDVLNLNWHILDDYKIDKREVGDNEYEFTVNFSAEQKVEKTDETTTVNHYRIKAKVNPDGKISEFNMSKVLQ